jgi:hypothetical protein
MTAQPLFQRVLGDAAWYRLAPAIRRHYSLSDGQTLVLHGVMTEIFHSPWIKPLLLIAQAIDALVPHQGTEVPVEVRNRTDPAHPQTLYWHRTFRFPDGRTTHFRSRMEAVADGQIVELLRLGIGIHLQVDERDGALQYRALRHCWKIGPWMLPIPNWLLLGDAIIIESAASAEELYLDFRIDHPLLGRTFGYRGCFTFEPMIPETS